MLSKVRDHHTQNEIRVSPPQILSVPEAARYIGISLRFMRSLIAERKIKVARIGGRVLLRLIDVESFIEKNLDRAPID